MPLRRFIPVLLSSFFGLASCSHSNNLLLGRVEAKLASHKVVVTDCYRTTPPQPLLTGDRRVWEPCRDARVVMEGERLTVNGKDYGALNSGDSILVDHGVVSTQRNLILDRARR